MRRAATLLACLLVASACTQTRPDDAEEPATTEPLTTEVRGEGRLLGMQGTVPRPRPDAAFDERLEETAPGLTDPSFAAEAYDAVILSALAAEEATSDAPGRLAGRIVEASRLGQKCISWRQCKDLLDAGADIDFDGASGAIDLQESGEPGEASFAVLRFTPDDTLEEVGFRNAVVDATPVPQPARDFQAGPRADGVLRIGLAVGGPGVDPVRAEAQRAGARIAVEEVNRIDGVLGRPVELLDASDDDQVTDTIEDHLDEGADVILGPGAGELLPEVIPAVTDAGVVLFSAAAAADPLTAATGRGLFFRMAPPRSVQAKVLAEVAAGDGSLELVVLAQEGTYGTALAVDFVTAFEGDLGGTVVTTLVFDPDSVDPAVTSAAEAASADGIVIFGEPEPAGELITTLANDGRGPLDTPWYTADISTALVDSVG